MQSYWRFRALFSLLPAASAALFFSTIFSTAGNAAVVKYDFEGMVRKSNLVVTGEVVEVTSYYASFQDLGEVILTDVKIRIEKSIKGVPEGKQLTIQCLGGRVGTAFQLCPESPQYEKGEKVLVFLREYNGRLWNTGWHQGKYKLLKNGSMVEGKEHHPIPREMPLSVLEEEVRTCSRSASQPSSSQPPPAGAAQKPSRGAAGPSEQGGVR